MATEKDQNLFKYGFFALIAVCAVLAFMLWGGGANTGGASNLGDRLLRSGASPTPVIGELCQVTTTNGCSCSGKDCKKIAAGIAYCYGTGTVTSCWDSGSQACDCKEEATLSETGGGN